VDRPFIILLAAVSALGPMAMQIFVPSLPWIQKAFQVSTAEAQLTLRAGSEIALPSIYELSRINPNRRRGYSAGGFHMHNSFFYLSSISSNGTVK
jgi:hypothetical protein